MAVNAGGEEVPYRSCGKKCPSSVTEGEG